MLGSSRRRLTLPSWFLHAPVMTALTAVTVEPIVTEPPQPHDTSTPDAMMPPHDITPGGTMRLRHTAVAIAVLACTLTACASTDGADEADAKPKATASKAAAQPAGLTAKQAAAELADATGVTDLGDSTDNTDSCSNKAAGKKPHVNDCTQLITTDTVSIYEYKTPAVAAHWVQAMKKAGSDWRQADRFALAWMSRDQKYTSEERRAELVDALKKLTAAES
jgi:hypothetical protein